MNARFIIFSRIFIFTIILTQSLNGYTVRTEMVTMRDSVRLATDIYQPVTSKPPWPVLLMRTPYNRSSAVDPLIALLVCNFMHYTLVIQNTRGRFGSEGVDSLYFSDGWGSTQDGFDTVEWIDTQSWCNGKIGTWGASAMGMTQYFMAGAAPPALDCCVVMVGASNLYEDALFYGGVYRESLVDGWLGGNDADQLIQFFTEHSLYEPMYDRINLLTRLNHVTVPMLHVGGWHDIFVQGQINIFNGLQTKGGPGALGQQKLIIGPWVHHMDSEWTGELRFPNADPYEQLGVMLDWFDYYLKDQTDKHIPDMPAVQYYLMGDPDLPDGPGNCWVSEESWPPEYQIIPFYFRMDSALTLNPPVDHGSFDVFTFDPDDPVPTVGGRNLNIRAGSKDQRNVETRDDVLVYTSSILEDSVIVAGPVSVTLYASSDALDTDFTAKLCDVYPDGRSMLVADGILRARHRYSLWEEDFLIPGEVAEFKIDLWSTAIAFAPGHAIRVSVSSSNSPRFAVNPNTGERFRYETEKIIANQTVYHSRQYPSSLNLPVVSGIETHVADASSQMPHTVRMDQNYPNPFNASTVIPVQLPNQAASYSLQITDILGRRIRQWHLSGMAGDIQIVWNGEDQNGSRVPTGMYIIQLTGDTIHQTRKMVMLQ